MDAPYNFAFMGKAFDTFDSPMAFQKWCQEWAMALLPLLYPGALVMCFGGPRTHHRLMCGLEDAGFELIDCLCYLFGQGFPKSQDLSKLIDKANGDKRKVVGSKIGLPGYSLSPMQSGVSLELSKHRDAESECAITAPASEQSAPWAGHKTPQLKPAVEYIVFAQAPRQGKTYAELALEYGSGALNVDGGRIGTEEICAHGGGINQEGRKYGGGTGVPAITAGSYQHTGRYPANLALECTCDEVELVDAPVYGDVKKPTPKRSVVAIGEFKEATWEAYRDKAIRHTNPDCPAAMLDEQAGILRSGKDVNPTKGAVQGYFGSGMEKYNPNGNANYGDSGGPSRFFYQSKASRSEREEGLLGTICCSNVDCLGVDTLTHKNEKGQDVPCIRNPHPTVKAINLCKWLSTLLLPPESVKPRRILVPFAGVGSEMIGCLQAGWDEIMGVEQDASYCEIAEARLAHWAKKLDE
jgi:site-specific DNA-methyltransferase (adenine-specific)